MTRCKVCWEEVKDLEPHIRDHIDKSYNREIEVFQETQKIRAIYKKLFEKDI